MVKWNHRAKMLSCIVIYFIQGLISTHVIIVYRYYRQGVQEILRSSNPNPRWNGCRILQTGPQHMTYPPACLNML